MANHGWNIGSIIAPKKVGPKNPQRDVQFEIGFVNDDGTVGLHPLGVNGKVTTPVAVVMTDQVHLQGGYKTVDESSRLSAYEDLSFDAPTVGQEFWQAVATQALVVASQQHRHCPIGCVYIQKKPACKVVVSSIDNLTEDGVVLVPYPGRVMKKRNPNLKVGVESSSTFYDVTVASNPPHTFVVEKPDMEAKLAMEFWRMRRQSEKEHANMEMSTVDVTIPLPNLGKGHSKKMTVTVPIAKSFKDIGNGDELVLWAPVAKKAEKTDKLLPVMQEPALKKARTD